jgi:NAD-dependent deacetylase
MIPAFLVDRLASARSVVFFTGAGVSRESGIPTFRDALTGLWGQFNAEKLATLEAFRQDTALVWGWYEWRRLQVSQAQPNAGHRAMAMLEDLIPQVTVITQNVNGSFISTEVFSRRVALIADIPMSTRPSLPKNPPMDALSNHRPA